MRPKLWWESMPGGTGVRVRVVDSDRVVWEGEAPSDPDGGPGPALALLRASGFKPVAIAAGIAKITRPGVESAWRSALGEFAPTAHLAVVPDFEIGFWASSSGIGVAVLAGTGSVVFGRKANGETLRVGGRGWEFGDEGSGTFLTETLLRRTVCALDGLDPATPLQVAVSTQLDATDAGALVLAARAACESQGRGFLAPLILSHARQGDLEAKNLFVGAAGWLATFAASALEQLGFTSSEPVPVAGIGGLWAAGELLTAPFDIVLHRRFPHASVFVSKNAPLDGAVRLAQRGNGAKADLV